MASYSINGMDSEELINLYRIFKNKTPNRSFNDLDYIFKVAVDNTAFPNINISGNQTAEIYIEHWANNYFNAMDNLPSTRVATPKGACSDPAIRLIVQHTQKSTDEKAIMNESAHNLFMSAENIQGNLLEEYISNKTRPYGFLWCNGNVLRATDFCTTTGSLLLQIKNKNNTENSSSSNIRQGTAIEKWYRLGTKKVCGIPQPNYRWDELNKIINSYKTEGVDIFPCSMSEEDYQEFLCRVARNNPNIISEL